MDWPVFTALSTACPHWWMSTAQAVILRCRPGARRRFMTSCAVKASPLRSRLARLPNPATVTVGVADTAGWQTRQVPCRCARQQNQALIMVRTHTPSRPQRISQGAPRSPWPRLGHCQRCFLAPRTPDTHPHRPPPTLHRAPDVRGRDLVCLALASPLSCLQALGYRPGPPARPSLGSITRTRSPPRRIKSVRGIHLTGLG